MSDKAPSPEVDKILIEVNVDGALEESSDEKLREIERQRNELADVLRSLYDYQNGCSLPKYEKYWNEAMTRAEAILKTLNK